MRAFLERAPVRWPASGLATPTGEFGQTIDKALAIEPAARARLSDTWHVAILMQDNRTVDGCVDRLSMGGARR